MYTSLNLQQGTLEMIKIKALWILLALTCVFHLSASENELSFLELKRVFNELKNRDPYLVLPSSLKNYHQQTVSIKGYVFEAPAGDWVLAGEPSLRSCCIGSEKEVFNQVYLECKKDPTYHNKEVIVEGVFTVEVLKNIDGEFVRVYTLKDAEVKKLNHRQFPIFTLSIFVVAGLFFFIRKRRKS